MIKDAAKELNVEAHVLRYWEEELGLAIKRNSMGHRYYDEKDIQIFRNVQELKKRGLSLKDIRDGIEKAKQEQGVEGESRDEIDTDSFSDSQEVHGETGNFKVIENERFRKSEIKPKETSSQEVKIVDFKMAQFQTVMNKVIANALRENKDIITASVKSEVTEDVIKQFDTVMREKEEKEEQRYKKLDECLREIQRANMEVAASRERGLFGRRKKAKSKAKRY